MNTIREFTIGKHFRVVAFKEQDAALSQQLMAMGLLPDTCFTIVRIAPFGDPIEIEMRGMTLCLHQQTLRDMALVAVN